MWWWVWSVLVVGTLVALFFVGRGLWRSGVGLARQASAASAALGSGAERISAAVAEAEANRPDTSPTLFDDASVVRARVAERRAERQVRRGARQERYRATWQVWTGRSWLERRQAEKADRAVFAPASSRSGIPHT